VSALARLGHAIVVAATGEMQRAWNLRVYDVHMWRSHLCAHGAQLVGHCGRCRSEILERAARGAVGYRSEPVPDADEARPVGTGADAPPDGSGTGSNR
jgi:hypothetical protein